MLKNLLFLFVFLNGFQLLAQNAISGHVDVGENGLLESKVYLAKLELDHLQKLKYGKTIAWSPIKSDGSFSFKRNHIANKDAVYRLYVNRVEAIIKDTVSDGVTFILSSADSIKFHKENKLFSRYTTTNLADKEWKRLKAFENRLRGKVPNESLLNSMDYIAKVKSYTKDSLKILMVKLISIKQLENDSLLDMDIAKNPDYYLTLLGELKASDLDRSEYFFLEKKLAYLTQEAVERKYIWSKAFNILLGVLVLGLSLVLVFRNNRRSGLPDLSRQERIIKNLILQGKTNKEIANELFISLSTVKTHITNIYSKLQVSGRQELLRKTQN